MIEDYQDEQRPPETMERIYNFRKGQEVTYDGRHGRYGEVGKVVNIDYQTRQVRVTFAPGDAVWVHPVTLTAY